MDGNQNQNNTREKEIDLDQHNNNEVQLDFNYPEIFNSNRQQNEENMDNIVISSKEENNDDIVVIQDESNNDDKHKHIDDVRADEGIIYAVEIEPQNNYNSKKNSEKFNQNYNFNENQNFNAQSSIRSPEHKPSRKENTSNSKQKQFFFEDIYKDILFFFINPVSGSNDGQLLIDMGVKKVEFLDTIKAAASSAYIFNILEDDSYKQGIALLKDYQERGKYFIISYQF